MSRQNRASKWRLDIMMSCPELNFRVIGPVVSSHRPGLNQNLLPKAEHVGWLNVSSAARSGSFGQKQIWTVTSFQLLHWVCFVLVGGFFPNIRQQRPQAGSRLRQLSPCNASNTEVQRRPWDTSRTSQAAVRGRHLSCFTASRRSMNNFAWSKISPALSWKTLTKRKSLTQA